MSNTVTNTSELATKNPALILASAYALGPSESIVAMEKDGQRELVASDVLPAQMDQSARERLESLGVGFIGPVEGDPVFVLVTLPHGWSKRPTNHDMWSELVDASGAVIARLFYKAAFYDRRASLSLA